MRSLIVNADDLGLSRGVNEGIAAAHEHGIVTSASLMVRCDGAVDAAKYALRHPTLDVGLHVDLGEWFFADGDWRPRYERVELDDELAVEGEVRSQLDAFTRLLGRPPTHLDSHQHVHLREPAASVVRRLADRLGLSVRHDDPAVSYCGDFYGQTETGEPDGGRITPTNLSNIIAALPEGTTELACHPAAEVDVETTYAAERTVELRALCHPSVRLALQLASVRLVRREAS